MTEELDRLKAKAEGMGLQWQNLGWRQVINIKPQCFLEFVTDDLATAHTLLAALDPKALKWKPSSSSMLPRPGYEYVIIERKVQE